MARSSQSSADKPSNADLASALAQFNQGVEASKEADRRQRTIAKAERRRKDAATAMKAALAGGSSAEERAAAEAEYRESVAAWRQLVSPDEAASPDLDGIELTATDDGAPSEAPSDTTDAAPTDVAEVEETEGSSDTTPVD